MNIFNKAKIKSILDLKIKSDEIRFYSLNNKSLHIKVSKRSKYTLDTSNISDHTLIRLLSKKIPNPSTINIENFFRRELRDSKISDIIKYLK